jgi:UDP-GlcNAc:undecaprenyl-phosphate/decaprenyl-phosphate GlcNAc-1-phosphate transferase
VIGLFVSFLVALGVTWAVTPWVVKLAERYGVLAVPRDRDVHDKPTPRWGGIAIYFGVVAAVAITITYRHIITHGVNGWNQHLVGILVAGTFIGLFGLLDDVKDLRALWQVLAILTAGAILIAFGVRVEGLTNPLVSQPPGTYNPKQWIELSLPVSIFLTLFWVFLVTKTVDAIDGLDGLAAGVCAISAATLALLAAASRQPQGPSLALLAAAVVGACVGFLRHNYNPARIFMSTVGAQFLGLTLAALSILGTFKIAAAISVVVPLLVLGVPIFDYGIVLFKRLRHKAPLTAADRRHLHHRLLDRGLSKKQAVWVIYGCTAALCVAAILLFEVSR